MIRREMRRAVRAGQHQLSRLPPVRATARPGRIEVVCLDNFLTGSRRNVAHLAGASGFQAVDCDVTGPLTIATPVEAWCCASRRPPLRWIT